MHPCIQDSSFSTRNLVQTTNTFVLRTRYTVKTKLSSGFELKTKYKMVWLSQKYPNCVPYGAQVGIHNMYVVLFSVPEGLDGMFYSNVM